MEIKFNCANPQCQQRVSVDESMAGQFLACPACAMVLQVPGSASIKFDCPSKGCGQHMVVDVSEAGRFVQCPACGKPSQVPGAPPKPLHAGMPEKPGEERGGKPVVLTAQKRPLPPGLMPFIRWLSGWGLGAVLCACVIGWARLHAWAVLPQHLDAMLDETYFHGEILTPPVENHAGTALLYVRTLEAGAGLFLVNLATLERNQIDVGKFAERERDRAGSVKLFGWSPGDEYFAYSTIQTGSASTHLVICDGNSGREINSFESPQPVEMAAWLTASSMVLLVNTHNSRTLELLNVEESPQLGEFGKKGFVSVRRLDRTAGALVCDSDKSVAYLEKGNLWSFEIPANRAFQLTRLTNATIDGLDYSATSQKYLLSAVVDGVKRKALYQYDPRKSGTLGAVDCTNYAFQGAWLPDGAGVAYIGSEGHGDYLAVAAAEPSRRTNLFVFPDLDPNSGLLSRHLLPEGHQVVRTYSLSPKRDKLYVVASLHYEPLGIWEYDLDSQSVRNVVPVKEHLRFSQFIEPVPCSTTNSAGKEVDYCYLPPAGLDGEKKHPVLMDLYSDLGFMPSSQFLANAGIFYVSVNPYGRAVRKLLPSPEDAVAVYQELLKNPRVDPRRSYVGAERDGTATVASLLEDCPDLWRGAVIMSPVRYQQVSKNTGMVPSIFISIGIKDDALAAQLDHYALDASSHHALMQILYGNEGHLFYDLGEIKKRYKAVAAFILENR